MLTESNKLIGAEAARALFDVSGKGMTAAVLDSGLYADHDDFQGKAIDGYDCRSESEGRPTYLHDENGHGTYVSGILAANGVHTGIAPEANLAIVKVLRGKGNTGSLRDVASGLRWVTSNYERLGISVVALPYSARGNHSSSDAALARFDAQDLLAALEVKQEIVRLREARIPVVVGAGNGYDGREGMGFPAILQSSVSVSAVNAADLSPEDRADVRIVRAPEDGIAHYAQRLHKLTNGREFTTILAPGSTINATGIASPRAVASLEDGTSAATPMVAGAILLLQQLHRRLTGDWPKVGQVVDWLRSSAELVADDCYGCVFAAGRAVVPTGKRYPRLQIDRAMRCMKAEINGSERRNPWPSPRKASNSPNSMLKQNARRLVRR